MTDDVIHATFRVYACPGGGFVLAELVDKHDGDMSQEMRRAVTNIDECVGAIGQAVKDWHTEAMRVRAAQLADENPKVVTPRKWWRAIR